MSHCRSNEKSGSRGSEQPWRSRGRGRGRGLNLPSVNPAGGSISTLRTKPPGTSFDTTQHKGSQSYSDNMGHKRRMNLMASVSRSSGLERDGDDLKNYKTQEEYREFIQEKVDDIYKSCFEASSESEDKRRQRTDAQENVLILFRKLREGVASSGRKDAFALEVYEISLYLSVIFESPKQTISIIPHLFPPKSEPLSSTSAGPSLPAPSIHSVLISLLHHLVVSYPSQSAYFQQLDCISDTVLPRTSEVARWLTALTRSLRTRNYARFSILSQRTSIMSLLENTSVPENNIIEADLKGLSLSATPKADPKRGVEAVLCLLEVLRKKASETAWSIIRSAYRELSCDQAAQETRTWLVRSLCLEPMLAGRDSTASRESAPDVESWLEARIPTGHVRRKEGLEGRWIVCKIR